MNNNEKKVTDVTNKENNQQIPKQKNDNVLDAGTNQSLKQMGIPKKAADNSAKTKGSPFSPGNLYSNKLRNGLNKFRRPKNANDQNIENDNAGRKKLSKMKNSVQPDEEAIKKEKRMMRALKVAKHIPIPQVKAAATAMEKANKATGGRLLSKGGGLLGRGKDSDGMGQFNVTVSMKTKIILFSIPLFLIIILVVGITSSITTSGSEAAEEANTATCMLESDSEIVGEDGVTDKCKGGSESAKAFYKRVKEVKREYDEKDKTFSPVYMAGFYVVVSNEESASGLEYDDMTKDKIREVADAMFDKDGETYSFDEDTFKSNLVKKVLPKYIKGASKSELEDVAGKIIDYVERYKSIYNIDSLNDTESSSYGDSDMANKLVEVAQHELDTYKAGSRGSKYRSWLRPNAGYFPWCATFVSWCANKAKIPKTIIPHSYARVNSFYDYFVKNKHGTWHSSSSSYKPRPGDLVIWHDYDNAAHASHIGIVKKYEKGMVTTIEGNTGYVPNDKLGGRTTTIAGLGCNGFVTPNYPKGGSTVNLKGSNYAEKTWNFLRSKGVSKETTAGIMGNLEQESTINPNSIQSNGPGRGIAQWGDGRFNNLVNRAKKHHKSWRSLDIQLDYLWYELSGGEATTKAKLRAKYGGFKHFIKAHNVEWATLAFEDSFERAGIKAMSNRYKYARSYYKKYGGKK